MKAIALLGRILFSLIFLISLLNHFSLQTIQYASSEGGPFANILVPAPGILAALGALSIVLGYRAQMGPAKNISMLGAALLITYFGSGPLRINNINNKYSEKPA